MAAPDLDIIKDVPGYKVILKAVLKSQIQQLVEQLAATAEEESVILTASVADGTLSHLGSSSGKGFLEDHEDIKSQFLGFCLKKHHRDQQEKERLEAEAAINQARLAAARQVSSHGHYLSRSPRFTSPGHGPVHPVTLTRTPRGRGIRSPANRHEPYPSARPPRRTSTEPSPAGAESDNGQFIKIEPNLESSDNENHDSNQTSQDNAPSVSKSESGERDDDAKSESSNSTIPNEAQAEGLGLDSDLSNIIAGSSQSQGSESGEIDANVSVKVEAISESDMELEITGVEPGRPLPQDTWDPNMSMGMNFDPSQGAAGNQADLTGPGYSTYDLQQEIPLQSQGMPTATYNSYTPSKGLKIPKADYIIQQNLNETDVQPGYCQFGGPGSNVLVTLKWKKTMEARTKNFKPAHTVKKYIDGFFNPWDLQGLTSGSLASMTGDKKEIFEALELFATSEFGFNSTQFNRIINTKAGTSRRAMNVNFPDYAVPKRKKFIP